MSCSKRRTLERAFDEAEYLNLDWHERRARYRAARGTGLLSSVLAVHEPGTTRTLSELEERFLAFCDSHGLTRPEVNVSIEGYLCDFVWREQRLIVETDGRRATARRRARRRDPIRDADLQIAGWRVMRIPSVRLFGEPAGVARDSWRGCSLRRRLQRPPHRVDRHDPAQHALAVHGHDRPQAGQALLAQQGLERLVEPRRAGRSSRRRGP